MKLILENVNWLDYSGQGLRLRRQAGMGLNTTNPLLMNYEIGILTIAYSRETLFSPKIA